MRVSDSFRIHSSFTSLYSNTSLELDSLCETFSREAGNWQNLCGMVIGAAAFRLTRFAALKCLPSSLGIFQNFHPVRQGLSWAIGLSSEVTLCRASTSSFFRWSNPTFSGSEGVFDRQAWLLNFIDFALLKGSARLSRNFTPLLAHALQDTAIVSGRHLGHALGFCLSPVGSLGEQLVHAEITSLQLEVGMKCFSFLMPSMRLFERNLDFQMASQERSVTPFHESSVFKPRSMAAIEGNQGQRSHAFDAYELTLDRIFTLRRRYGGSFANGIALPYLAAETIPHFDCNNFSHAELASLALPAKPSLVLNGHVLPAPRSLRELPSVANAIRAFFQSANFVRIEYDGVTYAGHVQELGRGEVGVVYSLGDDLVLKVSRCHYDGIATNLLDAKATKLWEQEAIGRKFEVAERYITHPFGLFSISRRAPGATLTKLLFQEGALYLNQEGGLQVNEAQDSFAMQAVWQGVSDFLKLIHRNPLMVYSAMPDNIHVQATADGKIRLTLIDFGPSLTSYFAASQVNFKVLKKLLPEWMEARPSYEALGREELVAAIEAEGVPTLRIAGENHFILKDLFFVRNRRDYLELAARRLRERSDLWVHAIMNAASTRPQFMGFEVQTGDVVAIATQAGVNEMGIIIEKRGELYLARHKAAAGAHLQRLSALEEDIRRESWCFQIGRYPYMIFDGGRALSGQTLGMIEKRDQHPDLDNSSFVNAAYEATGLHFSGMQDLVLIGQNH